MQKLDPKKLIDAAEAARYLLGAHIIRTLDTGDVLVARIVETEAYHQSDPASHTFMGPTDRNRAMFGAPGHAYIYFTYGMHWCFNVTAGSVGEGAGILIRAAEPLRGVEHMQQLRGLTNIQQLTNGPAKLAQALAIDKDLYGYDLTLPPLQVVPRLQDFQIVQTTRIGITKAVDEIARYYIKDNAFVSRA